MARRRKISRYRVIINKSAKPDKRPGLCERYFRIFASGVICIWILTRVFDFSLMPPSYRGLFITRPFYGLHSWDNAHMAWAARSHVKYGLGYTKGYRTLVVGDPPPAHPQRYVSHPSLETLITALGMLLLGTEEWSIPAIVPWRVRLDPVRTPPSCLGGLLILLLLRKLYGCGCALLSALLLVRPWPAWIVQLAYTSLAWRTFVNVLQVQALML